MSERELAIRWAQTWKEVGPAFEHALRAGGPEEGSGFVEMQRYFAKLRVAGNGMLRSGKLGS